MAKVDISRVGPGTLELNRDATTGEYSLKKVGFETINKLTIPDLGTQAVTTTPATTTEQKTATDLTDTGVGTQTQMAFRMPDRGGDNTIDTTGDMLAEAKKTSTMLSATFDSPEMRKRDKAKITSPLDIQSPTERVFDRPDISDVAGDTRMTAQEAAPQEDIETADFTDYERSLLQLTPQEREKREPKFLKDLFAQPKGIETARGVKSKTPLPRPSGIDAPMTREEIPDRGRGQLGIRTTKPTETALDMDRFAGISRIGTLADKDVEDVKPVQRSALETISTSLRTTKDSILSNLKTPMMMAIDAITPDPTAVNKHDTNYFTDRGDGRIGGNPATDLYAGMNRVSAFGNLEKAGEKRIARREQTIATKNVSQKFIDDTNKMKDQQSSYKASLDKNVTTKREAAIMNQPGSGEDTSGRSGGKIVCTMMNESYGFGSFRNKIWLRHSKNLAPEYQIGYHRIFLPLVKKAKTNKILKKILEHIAVHRTIDIRQQERNKIHLIGRVYRTILEPICYWAGKK